MSSPHGAIVTLNKISHRPQLLIYYLTTLVAITEIPSHYFLTSCKVLKLSASIYHCTAFSSLVSCKHVQQLGMHRFCWQKNTLVKAKRKMLENRWKIGKMGTKVWQLTHFA